MENTFGKWRGLSVSVLTSVVVAVTILGFLECFSIPSYVCCKRVLIYLCIDVYLCILMYMCLFFYIVYSDCMLTNSFF